MKFNTVAVSPDVYLNEIDSNTVSLNNSFHNKLKSCEFSEFAYKRDISKNELALGNVVKQLYSQNNGSKKIDIMFASSGVAIASSISLSKQFKNIYYFYGTYPEMINAYNSIGNACLLDDNIKIDANDLICIESYSVPSCKSNHEIIRKFVKNAHDAGAFILVDNTCETSFNYNPFDDNVDFVLESISKLSNGMNSSLLGALLCNDRDKCKELFKNIKDTKRFCGFYANPVDIYLCQCGI